MRPVALPSPVVALAAAALAALAVAPDARAQAAPPPAPAPAALPSVALPPALGRVLRDYEAAWRRGDAAGLAALFAEDGFVLQGGRAPARGRAAIRAAYAGQGGGPLRLRALAAAAADTVAYIVGAYGYAPVDERTPANAPADAPGGAAEDRGKFTLTLRRPPGGRWLIFSDMDNESRPPRRPGADAAP
jgi:ketosteroid isomerase-like protein